MLIALYHILVSEFLPRIGSYALSLLDLIMPIVIVLAGIVLLFGAVGFKISNNLGSTVTNGIFRAIEYLVRTLVNAIGWIIRAISRFMPRVYRESRRVYSDMGLNSFVSNLLAVITTVLVLAIII